MIYTPFNWEGKSELIDGSGNRLIPGKMKFAWVDVATGDAEVYQLDVDDLMQVGPDDRPLTSRVNLQLPLTVLPEGVTYDAGTTRRETEGGS